MNVYSPTSQAMKFYMIMPVRLVTAHSECKQQQKKDEIVSYIVLVIAM